MQTQEPVVEWRWGWEGGPAPRPEEPMYFRLNNLDFNGYIKDAYILREKKNLVLTIVHNNSHKIEVDLFWDEPVDYFPNGINDPTVAMVNNLLDELRIAAQNEYYDRLDYHTRKRKEGIV